MEMKKKKTNTKSRDFVKIEKLKLLLDLEL